ncbi:J domain-containing protein [Micrococcus sp.]|uniref:J domain-containing protein n=1 Tax=Micrococcus sp. TaxID=1271 RepID=UPI002A9110E8|nr:J domain-containing protein [Micrococcus sp.]MDY6055246.1 J domain-containing protein [Micrococcus sp.]
MASQDWLDKDFYATLGVSKDASESDIKKAYRKLARTHHPDQNAGNEEASRRFKEISEAYSVLSDPKDRQEYDALRAMGGGGARFTAPGGGGGGFEDVFGDMFGGGGTRFRTSQGGGPDLSDLLGAFTGGAGGFGGGAGGFGGGGFGGGFGQPQPTKGADRTATTTISFRGAVQGTTVSLRAADGETVEVKIPAGIRDGQKVRARGKGSPGTAGRGDLIVTVQVREHKFFHRDGDDLRITVPVTVAEAALGATVEVPTLDGSVKVKVPAGSQSGRRLRLKGRGVASAKHTGDLIVELQVVVPTDLDDAARAAVQALAEATAGSDPRKDLARRAQW